jgi:UDPglucose 6-dehydrogenase
VRVNVSPTATNGRTPTFRACSHDLQDGAPVASDGAATVGAPHEEETAVSHVRPRLTVIGTGYLGATHAICMAVLGYEVLALDRDGAKVAALEAGTVPFHEPGLPEMLRKALDSGRLRFTTDVADLGAFGDVHFVCVGTPQRPDGLGADLSQVDEAVRALAPHLHRPCVVVGKSTVPVGTAARLAAVLAAEAPAGDTVELAWNPEFLREGHAIEDTLQPSRLVLGVGSARARAALEAAYRPLLAAGVPCVVTDLETAELVKVAANSFLATKISFINAMAEVCEATGADVSDLAVALAHDDRIGGRFLKPGLGFGGGCLPKDIRAFVQRAEELGCGESVAFLREVDAINQRRRARVVDLVRGQAGGDLAGVRVCVLGAAFKPHSDDVRDAPALDVARRLHREGARVTVHDPQAMDNARRTHPELGYAASAFEAARGARVVALLTEWDQFRGLCPRRLGEVVADRSVVDARHALDATAWRAAGWAYRALGAAAPT